MVVLDKTNFLVSYRISEENFDKSGLIWSDLECIYEDYISKNKQFLTAGKVIAEDMHTAPMVHSIKYRVKDPEHLIEKIIRKKLENQERSITLENYQTEITDLLGFRALHLFKGDWFAIHEYILKNCDLHEEKPTVYIRSGDFDLDKIPEMYKDCKVKVHKHGYRSIHYLIKTKPYKDEIIAELQVRTIFEEGWSEIDHSIRYPYDVDNPILNPYIQIFNRLVGNADEMGTYIKLLKNHLDSLHQKYINELDEKNSLISDLETQISQLQKLDKAEKDKLLQEIKTLKQKVNIPYQSLDLAKSVGAFGLSGGTVTIGDAAISPNFQISPTGISPNFQISPTVLLSTSDQLLNNAVKLGNNNQGNHLVIPANPAATHSSTSGDLPKKGK